MTYLFHLTQTIEDLHKCEAEHVRSESFVEKNDSEVIWYGIIETFALKGHPETDTCYAWSFKDDDGHIEFVSVLKIPPVKDPRTALMAYISDYFKRSCTETSKT